MASIRKRLFGPNKDQIAYLVDYRDQHGKRHVKTFATKKDAERWKVDALHEVSQGTHTAAAISKTVEEVWRLWITECDANGLEFSTVRQRQQHLDHHVAVLIGSLRLSSLTAPLIYQFDSKLRDMGRSVAMRRKVLTNIKTMLSFAQGRGLVAQNVARGCRIKTEDREAGGPMRPGVDFPTRSELNTLIDKAKGWWRPFIVTAIFTGMRQSELRGLAWSNVDLDKGVIHVRQRASQWNRIGPPKSKAGKRDIPLTPMVVNALKQWRLACPHSELDLVFPTQHGEIMGMSTVVGRWSFFLRRCALPHYKFHALRHGAASLFIEYLKWDAKKIMAVMGHASIQLTFSPYGHLLGDLEADKDDMAKMEEAIRSA